jgi:hypothetical protein
MSYNNGSAELGSADPLLYRIVFYALNDSQVTAIRSG